MSEHTKKHPISAHSYGSTLYITHRHTTYAIPKNIADKYILENENPKKRAIATVSANVLFEKLDKKFTKAGALLKGLRIREDLSQIEFAKKIDVTQANLSKMENGHRPIGKIIAKRIEKVFGTNYRYFLE
jgi:DNA-binding XRE family transcriptional regulator